MTAEERLSAQKVIADGIENFRLIELNEDEKPKKKFRKTGGRFSQGLRNKTISQGSIIIVLICLIFSNFGAHCSFDTHQLLEDYFLIYFNIEGKRVVDMYTIFNAFAVPTGLITGFIIAWISPLLTCLLFCLLVLLSAIVSAYGVMTKKFIFMIVGKAMCGFGAEANEIAQYTLISIWFQGRFLSIASGLGQFVNNIAITISMLYTSKIFEHSRDMLTVYTLVGICCAWSVFLLAIFSYFDLKYGKPSTVQKGGSSIKHEGEKIDCKSWKFLNSKLVWYCIVTPWFSQQVYYSFSSWLTNLLTKRFQFELVDSTIYQALIPISVMMGIPFWSYIAVKKGKKQSLMIYGYIVVVFSFLGMWLMPERQTIIVGVPLFCIGQFLAIQSSCTWSSVCLASQASGTPLALGLVQFGSALVGAILNFAFSFVFKEQKAANFNTALLIMVVYSMIGCGISILSYHEDARTGGMLELPENSYKAILLKQMIDKNELLPLIKELEHKYKGDPKAAKKARMDLSRRLKVQSQALRDTIFNSETGEPLNNDE